MSFLPKGDPKELHRRKAVSQANVLNSTPMDADAITPNFAFNDPRQRFAVVNLANRQLRPRSVYPAIRVLGLFPTLEAANAWGVRISHTLNKTNIYVVQTNCFNLIPLSMEQTPQQCLDKVDGLLIQHYKNICLSKIDFDYRRNLKADKKVFSEAVFKNPAFAIAETVMESRNISWESLEQEAEAIRKENNEKTRQKYEAIVKQNRIEAGLDVPPAAEVQQEQAEETKVVAAPAAVEEGATEPSLENVNMDINSLSPDEDYFTGTPAGQKQMLIAFLQNEETPAYCIFAAFETLQECKGFDYNVLRSKVPEHNVNYLDMGRWVYPETEKLMDEKGLSVHRLDEQNRIMEWNNAHRNTLGDDKFEAFNGSTIEADLTMDEHGNIVPIHPPQQGDDEKKIEEL